MGQQQWQVFVARTLCFRDFAPLYDGICFLNKYDRVEYSYGCFRNDHVTLDDNASDTPVPFDTAQFRHAFEQHTRMAMHDAAIPENKTRTLDAVASFRLGGVAFQIVSTSYTSLLAVAAGKRFGLLVQRLPFGILVVVCRHPHTIEDVAPVVEHCCRTMR